MAFVDTPQKNSKGTTISHSLLLLHYARNLERQVLPCPKDWNVLTQQ